MKSGSAQFKPMFFKSQFCVCVHVYVCVCTAQQYMCYIFLLEMRLR